MSVSETQPISVGDLDAILPLPISAGGTGATTAEQAIVNLGIDTFVNQVVENWMEIQQAVWKGSGTGSAQNPGPGDGVTITLSETSSSTYVYLAGNQQVNLTNPGTYKLTGGFSIRDQYGYTANLSISGTGVPYQVLAQNVSQSTGTVSFTKSFTTTQADARLTFTANPNSYLVSPRFTVSNITIQRIS